jgi:hypothetical protein
MSISAITTSPAALPGPPAGAKRGPAFILPDDAGQTGPAGVTHDVAAPLQALLVRAQMQHATSIPGAPNPPNAADLPRAMRAYGAHHAG